MKKLSAMVLVLLATQVGAHCRNNCCWDPCCSMDGCFEVGGEALWWKATGADWQYAVYEGNSGTTTEFATQAVVADYDWGFRLFGAYYSGDCCSFAMLDWTYLRTRDADQFLDNENSFEIVNFDSNANKATGRICFDYDKVNLRFGRYLCSGCDSRLYAYAGGRYVGIEEKRSTIAGSNEGGAFHFHEKSCFQGGGFEVGFGGEYDLWCDFDFVANVGLTAQIGEVKNDWRATDSESSVTPDVRRTIQPRTICVPGAELRLGVNYTYKCDCWWIVGEVGYQMDYYWRALSLRGSDAVGAQDFSSRTSVGFAGLYFGLSARF